MYVVNKPKKYAANLEEALEVAGLGWFNITHSAVLMLCLTAFMMQQTGFSILLLASACDLNMSSGTRGVVASIPYIGFFLASYPIGLLVDTYGRKKTLVYCSFTVSVFSILAAFMPGSISFAVCLFFASLSTPCISAVPYTFVEEIMPTKYRDSVISLINGLQMVGSLLVPLLAWVILPLSFRINFGVYIFRPWRALNLVYMSLYVVSAILLCFFPESPKYLVSRGKHEEALRVLRIIYARNKGKNPDDYPIDRLIEAPSITTKSSFIETFKEQSAPFLKWMYLKWMLFMGFVLFAIFSILNGLYIWVPDLINRLVYEVGDGKTACEVHYNTFNQTSANDGLCHDSINVMTLYVNTIGLACCCSFICLVSVTVKFIGKKTVLIFSLLLTGIACILVNFITTGIVIVTLLSSLPTAMLGLGSVNAYIVEIIPTHLRGVALTVCIMLGTAGAIITSTISGFLINDHCEALFYLFASLVFLGAALSLFLPNTRSLQSS